MPNIGGIRDAELVGLDVAPWTLDPPTLRVRPDQGAGRLAAGALECPDGLFLTVTRHRTIVSLGMTSHTVYNGLAKRQREAG